MLNNPKLPPTSNFGQISVVHLNDIIIDPFKWTLHTVEMNYVQMYTCEPSYWTDIQNFEPQF